MFTRLWSAAIFTVPVVVYCNRGRAAHQSYGSMKFDVTRWARRGALSLLKPQGLDDRRRVALRHRDLAASVHHPSSIAMFLDDDQMCCVQGNGLSVGVGKLDPHHFVPV